MDNRIETDPDPQAQPESSMEELIEEQIFSRQVREGEVDSSLAPDADPPKLSSKQKADLRLRLAAHTRQLAKLSARLAHLRRSHKEAELELITRIGDVDDDRRMTANQMQRAWQAQRDKLESRLKRWQTMMVAGALIFSVAIGAILLLSYGKLAPEQKELADRVESLHQSVAQISDITAQDSMMQDKLARLSQSINVISSTLAELNQSQSLGVAGPGIFGSEDGIPAPLIDSLRHLQENQQELARQILSLRNQMYADEGTASFQDEAPASALGQILAEQELPEVDSLAASADTGTADSTTASQPADSTSATAETTASADTSTSPAPAPEQTGSDSAATTAQAPVSTAKPDTPATPAPLLVANPKNAVHVGKNRYAIQLLGAFSQEGLLQFSRRTDLPGRIYWREEVFRGKPWFVLIHSIYPTREAALKARNDLPPELAKMDLWVRILEPGAELQILSRSGGKDKPVHSTTARTTEGPQAHAQATPSPTGSGT